MSRNFVEMFERNLCAVCGSSDISQYFKINDSFISVESKFHSFREILKELQIFQIARDDNDHEVCLDCKEKVLKFYLFKLRVLGRTKDQRETEQNQLRSEVRNSKKPSKVFHKIEQIIESYAEKCQITSIKIDECNRKLIIESQGTPEVVTTDSPAVPVLIKEDPDFEPEDEQTNHEESVERVHDMRQEPSASSELPRNDFTSCHKWLRYQERRRKRMEILRLPNNQDLYERHKAQARERTRRYRAKMRQKKLQQQVKPIESFRPSSFCSFPFLAEVKLEELSEEDKANS